MAILLGAARVLASLRQELSGTVIFIGQPAEEKSPHGGARAIVASGILEGVKAVYGLHVQAQPFQPCLKEGVLFLRPFERKKNIRQFVVSFIGIAYSN